MLRPGRLLATLTLAVAIFATIGHVCVLPAHADEHAAAHDAAHDHHGPPQPDGAHVASCDALGAPTSASASAIAAGDSAPLPVVAVAASFVPVARVPAPSSSPPLYLAHAALLI